MSAFERFEMSLLTLRDELTQHSSHDHFRRCLPDRTRRTRKDGSKASARSELDEVLSGLAQYLCEYLRDSVQEGAQEGMWSLARKAIVPSTRRSVVLAAAGPAGPLACEPSPTQPYSKALPGSLTSKSYP